MKPYLMNPPDHPKWKPPHVFVECPSCGTKATRKATTWTFKIDGNLHARLECRPLRDDDDCTRVFDVVIPREDQ